MLGERAEHFGLCFVVVLAGELGLGLEWWWGVHVGVGGDGGRR